MSIESFTELAVEVSRFYKNLQKDPQERRQDITHNQRKWQQLCGFREKCNNLKKTFNEAPCHDPVKIVKVKDILKLINNDLTSIEGILVIRLNEREPEQIVGDEELINDLLNNKTPTIPSGSNSNMGEKFDLKTAAAQLPVMDGTEFVTKRLMNAIELYDELLDDAGKKLLTKYVLKTCLSEYAMLRLQTTYENNAALIKDLKSNFITVKSSSTLFKKLNDSRQGNKTIDEYGRELESLMVDLTISQAAGDVDAQKVLRKVNENIAVRVFADGLNKSELGTIVKAKDCENLKDAISSAKRYEPTSKESERSVFHTQNDSRKFYNQNRGKWRGNYRGRSSFNPHQRNFRPVNNNTFEKRSYQSYQNRNRSQNSQNNQNKTENINSRNRVQRNSNNYQGNNSRRAYVMHDVPTTSNVAQEALPSTSGNRDQFFRVQSN